MFVADIAAYPDSVNVLEGVENDVRTPDKLIDGVSDTTDGCHMWLAPILPGIVGIFYHVYDFFYKKLRKEKNSHNLQF